MKNVPSEEEFEAWQDHPVTKWVLDAYARLALEQKAAWIQTSWEAGSPNHEYLLELRTRADAYSSMAESTLGDLIATHEAEIPDASL